MIWTTKSGLRAHVTLCMGHWNGYVEVPKDSILFGLDYNKPIRELEYLANGETTLGKKGCILMFTCTVNALEGQEIRSSPDIAFDVHGGLTYAGGMPGLKDDPSWWFGFDTGHHGDTPENCPKEYVISECERLAEQLQAFLSKQTKENNEDQTQQEVPQA